jgi:hypothetical protein
MRPHGTLLQETTEGTYVSSDTLCEFASGVIDAGAALLPLAVSHKRMQERGV